MQEWGGVPEGRDGSRTMREEGPGAQGLSRMVRAGSWLVRVKGRGLEEEDGSSKMGRLMKKSPSN